MAPAQCLVAPCAQKRAACVAGQCVVQAATATCEWSYLGGDGSCRSYDAWKQITSKACRGKGGQLNNLSTGSACAGGNFAEVKYECCPAKRYHVGKPRTLKPTPPRAALALPGVAFFVGFRRFGTLLWHAGRRTSSMAYDESVAQRVRHALGKHCNFDERRMFGGLAFMVGGHMCCGIVGKEMMVRVGPASHADALAAPHARVMDFTGRPSRGMVYVGAPGFNTARALDTWIKRGLSFVRSLPARAPKPLAQPRRPIGR